MSESKDERKIYVWEPWFFLFFGGFHLHRIWALVDRKSYASFWMGLQENKEWPYFLIMGVLGSLCVLGIVTFIRQLTSNYWWRWIYICGGAYLLFDLFAIAAGLEFWHDLLGMMFDIESKHWNVIWGGFIALGAFVFFLGISLLRKRSHIERGGEYGT